LSDYYAFTIYYEGAFINKIIFEKGIAPQIIYHRKS